MYLSPSQAAKQLGVCKKTIYRRIADGSLPAVRLAAKTIRIDEKELDAFVDKLKTM